LRPSPEAIEMMMKFIVLVFVICALQTSVHASPAEELSINVTLTKGESSKDSHSTTTTINLKGDHLTYAQTSRGFRAQQPVRKEFKLVQKDLESLKSLVREKNLLDSDTLEVPLQTSGFRTYFSLTLDLSLGDKKSQIKISGPRRTAGIKDKDIYKNASALLELIYTMINEQDKDIGYENRGLVSEPVKPTP
jgi:hypothetical protein